MNSSMDDTIEEDRGYIPNQFGALCLEGATDSDRGAVDTENLLCGTVGGFRKMPEGVENVSIEDVDGDGPFAGARPKAGGTAEDGEVLSVIGESDVLRIDPTTDSVCEGDKVGRGGGNVPRGGGGCTMGGDKLGERRPNGMRHPYGLLSGLGLGGGDGSDAEGGKWNRGGGNT